MYTSLIMAMAFPISASAACFCSSSTTKYHLYTISSLPSYTRASKPHLSPLFSHHFSPYSGLKHLGISISPKALEPGRKKRCRGMVVHASLFGVGAPEALVIGVVALLVFGPKGLAEVARNLGKTLRAFQPTIRELQEVSREFKSTLEREIGLDDISTPNTYSSNQFKSPPSVANTEDPRIVSDPNGAPSPNRAYTTEDYLKITEEQLKASSIEQPGEASSLGEIALETEIQPQEQLKASATQTFPAGESQSEALTQPEGTSRETASATSQTQVYKNQT